MTKFLVKRVLSAIPVIFIVITLVFFLMRIIPGNPALMILGDNADPIDVANLEEKMGLNDSYIVQYKNFLVDTLSGNWGESLYNNEPVFENIRDRLEPTILMAVYSTVISVIIGIPMGVIAARKRNTFLDYTLTTVSSLGTSVPMFWLGMMMVYYLGVQKHWFPVMGYHTVRETGVAWVTSAEPPRGSALPLSSGIIDG